MFKEKISPKMVKKVAIIGTGVIGSGWAIHCLRKGKIVKVYDPDKKTEIKLRAKADKLWPLMEKLGLDQAASLEKLIFSSNMKDAIAEADVVQECAPENIEVKKKLFAELDKAVPKNVVILSSTSGFSMSLMQINCENKERMIVGHPFNPPYLMPLVEVLGGKSTSKQAINWAVEYYENIDKYVVKMDKELPAFIANRFQHAIWREILHMIDNEEATVDQIDRAMIYGPGLRWAIMGPILIYHLAGGEGGIKYFLEETKHEMDEPYTRLKGPKLTEKLIDKIAEGILNETGGKTVDKIEKERDEKLVKILKILNIS